MLKRVVAVATGQIRRWNELHRSFYGSYLPRCEELSPPAGPLILGSLLGGQMVLEISLAPNPKARPWVPMFKRDLRQLSQESFNQIGLTAAGAVAVLCERDPSVQSRVKDLAPALASALVLKAPVDSVVTQFRSMILASPEAEGAFEYLYGQLAKMANAASRSFTGLIRDIPYFMVALERGANFGVGFARELAIETAEN